MANPSKKQRLSVYLEPEVMKALAAYSARRDQSRSLIAKRRSHPSCRRTLPSVRKRRRPNASISSTVA